MESVEKVSALARIQERAMDCQKCPHLVAFRTQVVFGVGNPDAKIMFVGEAPGADEDLQGEPFVGAAGQLLTKMIGAMGLDREAVYIANVLKCRPDMPGKSSSGNRKPTGSEMATCLPYLSQQIEIVRPMVLVALGATAVEGLLGLNKVTMGAVRSVWHDFRGIPVMPTYHPAYLLRNQSISEKRKVWEDLLQVMERVGLPISPKQQGYFQR
jgi:DNA polymerase